MTIKLNQAALKELDSNIQVPTYDRQALTPGIVHIGLGNFHRAHQSWYLHRLFQEGKNRDWAIIGAGVRSYDAEMREKMIAQDFLTTLIELNPDSSSAEVIGSMIDYLPIEEGNASLIQKMADPAIRIVSLTVTEGGYYIDPATKGFDENHPDIQYDAQNPETPKTAFGAMVAALKIRRDNGTGPFTGQSCDNLQGNGYILKQTIVSLAKLSDLSLAEWIADKCSFPNSMVDCIVPATGPNELTLAKEFGIDDQVPVTHESFRQWVIEDDFCAGRPDWDQVGATFSDNVHGFEAQKIRILNAGHQIFINSAELLNIETIAGSLANKTLFDMLLKIEMQEIVPHVVPVPGMTPEQYVDLICRRFSNPKIVDTVRRVAFDGSSRHPGFIIPTIREGLDAGTPIDGLALVEASWARMCEGTREDGSIIEANDPFWEDLNQTAIKAKENPITWLQMSHIYGDLVVNKLFTDTFDQWLRLIYSDGIEAAIKQYITQ